MKSKQRKPQVKRRGQIKINQSSCKQNIQNCSAWQKYWRPNTYGGLDKRKYKFTGIVDKPYNQKIERKTRS